ncbi:UNVERIFIED_CONTAM: hypothetical protein GTU68_004709 [Idotea baltica]|nr:hypothetical protein [Idotea baltica]
MQRALSLAACAEGATLPNPMVGAVVVQADSIVGEGYHVAAGRPHAEVIALEASGSRAVGATLYVTLEPCNHHGRTPPCAELVIESGISRVVVASLDPNKDVCGGGIQRLTDAGLRVSVGLLSEQEEKLNQEWRQTLSGSVAAQSRS